MQNRGKDSIWELRVLSTYSCFIFTFALLKNMKLCSGQHWILGHGAVISNSIFIAITDGEGVN